VICKDLAVINLQAKRNIDKFVTEKLPVEYEKCIVGLTEILKTAWTMTYQQDIDKREKLQALSLAKECYTTKLELLTNSSILADAMKFVTRHQQQNQQNQEHLKLDAQQQQQQQEQEDKKSEALQQTQQTLEAEEEPEVTTEEPETEEDDDTEQEVIESEADEETTTTTTVAVSEDQIF